ncbi:MAG: NAD(P)-dependent oxidoreductase [Thiotrichaceae bacterium]
MERIAFIGLGTMGYPMAGHLVNKGYEVTVFNRTGAVAEKWATEYEGKAVASLAEAVNHADVVITCLGNDEAVYGVYAGASSGQSVFDAMKQGAILIDHTTTSATLVEKLSVLAQERGAYFLDAPVSGGQVGAEQGVLTIMVGGDEQAFQQCEAVLSSYAKAIKHVGKSGDGQRCKMVNQLCVAGVLQGLSEGLELAKQSGFSAETILDALQHGAGSSWQMVSRTETMMKGEFDFGFAVDWMRKDLGICLDEAKKHGLDLPLARMVDSEYKKLQERGHQRSDTSVLICQFDGREKKAGDS